MEASLHAIRHRGPDGSNYFVCAKGTVALGHVRLAILDLDQRSAQPFHSDCGRFALTYNGEIYNYVELRSELEQLGHHFQTTSDTEVLLKALIEWGTEALHRLNGMWAFVFVDRLENLVTVARDRWGVKPLYELRDRGVTYFGSEPKALAKAASLKPQPDERVIRAFLAHGRGSDEVGTWFRSIERVAPGTFRQFRDGAPVRSGAFWSYPQVRDIVESELAVTQFADLLDSSTEIRLRSDVPIGLALSGGLDSAAIALSISKARKGMIRSFTFSDIDVERDECAVAAQTAAAVGIDHETISLPNEGDVCRDFARCIYQLDSAHTSTAIVPYLRVCRAARRKVKVLLEGQGADELLAGYPMMLAAAIADHSAQGFGLECLRNARAAIRNLGFRGFAGSMLVLSSTDMRRSRARWWGRKVLGFEPGPVDDAFRIAWGRSDNLSRALANWHRTGLVNLLHYGDAISMSCGIEARCPFLDFRLVGFAFRCETSLLVSGGLGKSILRRSLLGTPLEHLAHQRLKKGFTNSVVRALREQVFSRGWDREGLACALDHGFVSRRLLDGNAISSLTDSQFYRIFGTIEWCRIFQTGGDPDAVTGQALTAGDESRRTTMTA